MNPFAIALLVLTIGGGLALTVTGIVQSRSIAARESYSTTDGMILAVLGACLILIGLLLGWMATDGPDIQPGCYRVSTSTGTGVGSVGGKVGVVVISDRTYEPIECPS